MGKELHFQCGCLLFLNKVSEEKAAFFFMLMLAIFEDSISGMDCNTVNVRVHK